MVGPQNRETQPGPLILIVEDSPTQVMRLRYILEKGGYRVSSAGNGRQALTLIAGEKPALVISDVIMPEMNGFELCRRIKDDERYRDIPLILLTTLGDPQDVIRGLECGADNFITKPYSEDYLLSRIEQVRSDRCQVRDEGITAGMEILFAGEKYTITAGRRQILNLLLSTYEAAIQRNTELITARDELNELNARLQSANQELAAFSYTVSHDLRAPLSGIIGFSEVLLELCSHRLDEQSTDYIRHIFEAAGKMNGLITTLLDFSRLSQADPVCREVDLSRLARKAVAELKMKEPERSVSVAIAEGITAYGDERLLSVVLANLLGNAWKYTGKRDEAAIEVGVSELAGIPTYFCRDNGCGFDMAAAGRLFSPFQRLHDGTDFEGNGIGLATVQRIIQRHGGQVWAEGERDRGATFYFTLPRCLSTSPGNNLDSGVSL